MTNLRKSLLAAACAALAVVAAAPAANAATTLGNSSASAGSTCTGSVIYIGGGGGASYVVPPGGGVITSFTVNRSSGIGYVALKLLGTGIFADKVINATSQYEYVTTTGPVTRATRLPAAAGETLALWQTTDIVCMAAAGGENVARSQSAVLAPAAVGTAFDLFGSPINGARLALSAKLEADVDGDGYGDETQDGCPTNPGVQGACPVAAPAKTCKVPALKGLTKKAATTALTAAGCKLGKAKSKKLRKFTKKQKKNRIRTQTVKAGSVVPAGTTVGITINVKKKK